MYKKVFVSKLTGELSFNKCEYNEQASSDDLLEAMCLGQEEILGLLLLTDGIFTWVSNLGETESIKDIGMMCEYVKIGEIPIEKESITDKIECVDCSRLVACLASVIALKSILIEVLKKGMIG